MDKFNIDLDGNKILCEGCDVDRRFYSKLSIISNKLYNEAVEEANKGEITKSIRSLKKSIEFDKKNVRARNLLGLCYYKIGKLTDAIKEWVISVNIKPENNLAQEYLEDIEENPDVIEKYNNAYRLYNDALDFLKHGDEDVAIINLKNVIKSIPNFIDAKTVLGLCYVNQNHLDEGIKEFEEVLDIDSDNQLILEYIKDLKSNYVSNKLDSISKLKKENEKQFTKMMFKRNLKNNFLNPKLIFYFFSGVVFASIFMSVLVMPGFNQYLKKKVDNLNIEVASLKEDLNQKGNSLTENEDEIKRLNNKVDSLNKLTDENSKLNLAYIHFKNGDSTDAASILVDLNIEQFDENATDMYEYLKQRTFDDATEYYYRLAKDKYYDNGDYVKAREYFNKVLDFNMENAYHGLSIYFVGSSNFRLGNTEKAKEMYRKYLREYPNLNDNLTRLARERS